MSELVDFNAKRFSNLATTFVDIYEDEGPMEAAAWAEKELVPSDYTTAQEYIALEFLSRGYYFDED